MAAWLAAAGVVINAPGHAAQFLKPRNEEVYKRIRRQWQRSSLVNVVDKLDAIQPVGTKEWRVRNRRLQRGRAYASRFAELRPRRNRVRGSAVHQGPLLALLPPLRDALPLRLPGVDGVGRYRPDRFQTPFSLARNVESAFRRLFAAIARRGLPLVLSYPDNGLLHRDGTRVAACWRSISQSETSTTSRSSTRRSARPQALTPNPLSRGCTSVSHEASSPPQMRGLENLEVAKIQPNEANPRLHFPEEEIDASRSRSQRKESWFPSSSFRRTGFTVSSTVNAACGAHSILDSRRFQRSLRTRRILERTLSGCSTSTWFESRGAICRRHGRWRS